MSTMKRGGKPDKVNIKRILNEEKEALKGLKEKMELLSERLSLTLDSGGVPNVRASEVLKPLLLVHGNDDTSDNLREKLENSISSLIEATNAVEKAWSYCLCYPSLNVPNIADIIEELQSALCESASLANKPLQRKLVSLKSDPKADVVVLNELEGISKRVIDCTISVKALWYKTHVRKLVWSQNIRNEDMILESSKSLQMKEDKIILKHQ